MRLDQYLAQKNPRYSRTFWQKAIKEGCIQINGEVITLSKAIICEEDQIDIADKLPIKPIDETLKAEDIPLDIVYEDNDVIVINKAYDMVVHPAFGNTSGTLVNALLHHTKTLSNDPIRPGIVHRLDKGTNGLNKSVCSNLFCCCLKFFQLHNE